MESGAKPSIDATQIAALKAEGLGATAITQKLGIGRASVYRVQPVYYSRVAERLEPVTCRGLWCAAGSP
jgi:hypothetical protein